MTQNNNYGVNSLRQKQKNHGLVLKIIATGDAVSRTDISARIGLTKMAVTNIVSELIDQGFVAETEKLSNAAVGRNRVMLDISTGAPLVIGVYISRMSVSAVLTDLKLRLISKVEQQLSCESHSTLTDKMYYVIDRMIEAAGDTDRILGVGVSSIGPVDSYDSRILNPRGFFGISDYSFGKLISERYGLRVISNNDMNAAALAERLYGRGSAYTDFIYMGLTAGVGAGIVTQGQLFQNNSSFAGELGHVQADSHGELCECGMRGCLEQYASMPVVLAKMRETTGMPELTYKDMRGCWQLPDCRPVFDCLTDKISLVLTSVTNLINPQCIIIGHEGYYLPEECFEKIEGFVNSHILAASHTKVRVIHSHFGEDAPLVGAACCLIEALFDGEL